MPRDEPGGDEGRGGGASAGPRGERRAPPRERRRERAAPFVDDDPDHLRGNRSWRLETSHGPVLQKLYAERTGCLRATARELLIRLAGLKTGSSPEARRATERRMLALWRACGEDVPEDRTDALPQFGGPGVALFEFVEGTTLHDLLEPGRLEGDARRDVLRRFGAAWGRRHAEAFRRGEAGLLQEHGSIRHAIVSRDRLVTIDLEQAFLPRRDLRPLVAKEVADTLRSLWKRVGEERFAADLGAILDGYGEPATLAAAAAEYLEPRTAGRRLLWALDRRLRRRRGGRDRTKYGPLEVLAAATKPV